MNNPVLVVAAEPLGTVQQQQTIANGATSAPAETNTTTEVTTSNEINLGQVGLVKSEPAEGKASDEDVDVGGEHEKAEEPEAAAAANGAPLVPPAPPPPSAPPLAPPPIAAAAAATELLFDGVEFMPMESGGQFVPQAVEQATVAYRRNSSLMCVDVFEQYQTQLDDNNDLNQYFQDSDSSLPYYNPASHTETAHTAASYSAQTTQYIEAYLVQQQQQPQVAAQQLYQQDYRGWQQQQQQPHQQQQQQAYQAGTEQQQESSGQLESNQNEANNSSRDHSYYYNNQYFYQYHQQPASNQLLAPQAPSQEQEEQLHYRRQQERQQSLQTDEAYDHHRHHHGEDEEQQQHWTSEGGSCESDQHYYEPSAYLQQPPPPPPSDKQYGAYHAGGSTGYSLTGLNDEEPANHESQDEEGASEAYGSSQQLPASREGGLFAEQPISTIAPLPNVAKYDDGGSIIEYYPTDSYTPSCYHSRAHQSTSCAEYNNCYNGPSTAYYGRADEASAADERRPFYPAYAAGSQAAPEDNQLEGGKTYHLLKQSSGSGSATELAHSRDQSYYDGADRAQRLPVVSRLYDPNTEISSALLGDAASPASTDGRSLETAGEEEDGEDSLASSSASLVTVAAAPTKITAKSCGGSHRSRPKAKPSSAATAAGAQAAKLSRCAPATIERLRIFLQRRQLRRSQGSTGSACCSSAGGGGHPLDAADRACHNSDPDSVSRRLEGQASPRACNSRSQQASYSTRSTTSTTSTYRQQSALNGRTLKAGSLSSSPASHSGSYDESSNQNGSTAGPHPPPTASTTPITTCHHRPTSEPATMTENRQLRNRTIVISSTSNFSTYSSERNGNNNSAGDLKRQQGAYGLETRSSKRRRFNDQSQETSFGEARDERVLPRQQQVK